MKIHNIAFAFLSLFAFPVFADTVATVTPIPSPVTVVQQPNIPPNSNCAITYSVLAAIAADPLLAGQSIRVSTIQGMVSLDGTVSSPDKVTEAVAQAKSVSGVTSVKSYLNVQGGATGPNGQ